MLFISPSPLVSILYTNLIKLWCIKQTNNPFGKVPKRLLLFIG
nr:MAG TPA_asm: hypothetical protein [Caudoviricetes sp.]